MEIFEKLAMEVGISGREKRIREIVKNELSKVTDDVKIDHMGNTFGTLHKNGGVKIMLAGHMDEVGLLIMGIRDDGFLEIVPIGGLDPKVLLSQAVVVENTNGEFIPGVIGAVPPHFGVQKELETESLLIDIGAESKDEAIKYGIEVGCQATFKPEFFTMKNKNRIVTKAIDNRFGTGIVLETFTELAKEKTLKNTVVAGATVQEEVGLRGASAFHNYQDFDLIIAVDASPASDMGTGLHQLAPARLGKGFLLRVYDRGNIMPDGLRKYIKNLASENKIPFQEFMSKGGTDAISFQYKALAITIGLPARYIHSSKSIADKRDIKACKDIIKKIVLDLTKEKLIKIKEEN